MMTPEEAAYRMVATQLVARGIANETVLRAMRQVPRHLFFPGAAGPADAGGRMGSDGVGLEKAYSDRALPTAQGQTISQPYIVARMTELLEVRPGDRVLEIGTGSGYQTAILLHLGARVVSVERHHCLAEWAEAALAQVAPGKDYRILLGDGTLGYPAAAPYDRVMVTAYASRVPEAYRDQLADGGIIVMPVGGRRGQVLTVFRRTGDAYDRTRDVACRFVPLLGGGEPDYAG